MAITEESNGFYMPVAPAYGGGNGGFGNGFGGDGWWVLLLLLAFGGGWGNGFGGFGGGQLGYDFPWLLNGQNGINSNVSGGFRDAQLHDSITSVRDGVNALATQLCGCCGDIQMSLANGFSGVNAAITNANISNLERSFATQTAVTSGLTNLSAQLAQCCCDNRLATEATKYTIASESCATRTADANNTTAVLNAINGGIQSIKDQLCSDKIDAKNEKISDLERQLTMATLRESQTAQNAFISRGFENGVDALYNRLSNCPVPTTPVYGRTPIFTCNGNGCGGNCGCGCGGVA